MSARRKASRFRPSPATPPPVLVAAPASFAPVGAGVALGCAALVVVVVLAVHWPVLSARAVAFDDSMYLDDNPLVRNPSWTAAGRFLGEVQRPSTVGGYYQPLAMISLMLDVAAGGTPENRLPFHRTSLLLHAANALFVLLILLGLFGRPAPAIIGALLFGLHPMTVEPIAWVAERKTPLAAFFALGCLALYVRHARRPSWAKLGACLGLYVLALMAKPTATPIPLVLLILDGWPLRRMGFRTVLEKIPFLIVAVISAAITYESQAKTSIAAGPSEQSPVRIFLTVCHNIVFYICKWIRPTDLTPHWPHPEPFSLSHPWILAGVVGTPILVGGLALAWRWTRGPLAGWLIFMLTIFPTLGVVGFTNVIASDKYAYLAMIGFVLPVVAGLVYLVQRAGRADGRRSGAVLMGAGAAAVLVAMSLQTRRQIDLWQDSERLGEHMVRLAPDAPEPHVLYGTALAVGGNVDEAIEEYREALRCRDFDPHARYNLAALLDRRERADEAIAEYQRALYDARRLVFFPDTHKILNNLGVLYRRKGDLTQARRYFEEALRIRPEFAAARVNLEAIIRREGQDSQTLEELERAVSADPSDAAARVRLADALMASRELGRADAELARALALQPNDAQAQLALGRLRRLQGRHEEALAALDASLRLSPENPEAHLAKARVYMTVERWEDALAHYAETARLRPLRGDVQADMGMICSRLGRWSDAIQHYRAAMRLEPGVYRHAVGLALAQAEAGETDEAVTALNRIAAANPADTVVRHQLAKVYRRAGRFDEAIAELRALIAADPNEPGAHLGLGLTFEAAQRRKEAIREYEEALRLKPDLTPAAEGLARLRGSQSPASSGALPP